MLNNPVADIHAEGQILRLTVSGSISSINAADPDPEAVISVDGKAWQVASTCIESPTTNTPQSRMFECTVQARDFVRVAMRLDGKVVNLQTIAISSKGYKRVFPEYLQHYLSGGQTNPLPVQVPVEKRRFEQSLSAYISTLRTISEHDFLRNQIDLPEALVKALDEYRIYVRTHQNLTDLTKNPSSPSLRHPISRKTATATHGGHINRHTFWIRFTDGIDSFYILQKVSALDGVFIPSRKLLFKFQHMDVLDLNQLILSMLLQLDQQAKTQTASRFLGFNVSHSRPAHLLQDVLPGLAVLQEKDALPANIPLCMLAGGDYLEPSRCFNHVQPAATLSGHFQPGEYISLMGAPMAYAPPGKLPPEFYQRLFARLIGMAETLEAQWGVRQHLHAGQHFVLWVGISAQKRIWLNQAEGLARLIETFQNRYPNLVVAFDGWTSPLHPTQADLTEIQRDRLVMIEVLNRLPIRPAHIDLIGQTMSKKIAVAACVNFYFTSALTGSVWVSRAFQKKGMLHISNPLRAVAVEHQANPNARLLEGKWVKEVDAEANTRFDCIDYTIDLEGMLSEVKRFTPEFGWANPQRND